ncbi:16S rRNA (guanine(966)-N(2))-methyltransferase RsmD [Buchnera aphidicola (Kurisakia onigurumii)]|uniref:16S rRNA (guanine(966)-N(2))-methyltransferase RsmD n=1 Tax=Buchnera aphidicola TaxID=9 RepID=UPI0031B68EBA
MRKKLQKKIYLRIISGKFGSRKIHAFYNKDMRPTTSIIRETLFNWLDPHIIGSNCLDCFSGSGILGIEAISRNASSVVSLENKKKNFLSIKSNLKKLSIQNLKIIYTNTLHWLKKNNFKYDIIFIDPPFHLNLINQTIFFLYTKKYTKKNTLIYIEYSYKNSTIKIPETWILYKKKKSGTTIYSLYINKN